MLYDLMDWIGNRLDLLFFMIGRIVNEMSTTNVMEWSASAWLLVGSMLSILLLGVIVRR